MGAGEEHRKLLCQCGKPLGIFTAQGLELYCRFSKESTTVPYTISNLEEAVAFVEATRAVSRVSEIRIGLGGGVLPKVLLREGA
jgi:hypothetical protein